MGKPLAPPSAHELDALELELKSARGDRALYAVAYKLLGAARRAYAFEEERSARPQLGKQAI